ncbi:uncharacterized protein B0J16DRAFT_274511 [Fusarium flagelliforme]|uniref:uncharacterized protein n=1 Tax=Fusarium flagelliforme TaxID=2675880 RepID=UPI001E8D16E7|nr:uncharacterized protein B0J16DRAFT_274511 [Fusarium flagelliforme]KAH7175131.1 hypothetical protein B0J16DRAFT_274511 [Fusarium flagelliforme]
MPELPSSDGVELKLSNSQSAPVDNNLTSVRDAFITGDPDDAGLYEEAVDTVNLTQHNDEDSELPPLPLHEYRASTPISPLCNVKSYICFTCKNTHNQASSSFSSLEGGSSR